MEFGQWMSLKGTEASLAQERIGRRVETEHGANNLRGLSGAIKVARDERFENPVPVRILRPIGPGLDLVR